MIYEELSKKTINAFYKVYNTLGHGFLEKVYHNAMLFELEKRALDYEANIMSRLFTKLHPSDITSRTSLWMESSFLN